MAQSLLIQSSNRTTGTHSALCDCRNDCLGAFQKTSVKNLTDEISNETDQHPLVGICFWRDRHYDEIVILPSITETAQALARTKGIAYYEHRTLFELALLLDPSIKKIIYLSALPVDKKIIEYYWSTLLKDKGLPFSEVERRFVQVSLNDATVRPLSHKILESPDFVDKVKSYFNKKRTQCLIPWLVTSAEHEVANRLGIPILSHEAEHYAHGTKIGAIKIFQEANIPYPFGTELVRSEEELASALFDLWQRVALEEQQRLRMMERDGEKRHMDRFVVKLDDSASGGGNAIIDMRKVLQRCRLVQERDRLASLEYKDEFQTWLSSHREMFLKAIGEEFASMQFCGRDEAWPTYRAEIPTQGAHAELFIDHQFAPSCQAIINTDGQVTILSTHEQILDGQVYLGCKFPCNQAYRHKIQEYTMRVGKVLAKKGALGYFGVDFLASRTMPVAACLTHADTCDPDQSWELFALEINLRQSGTTHPMMIAKLLTSGKYDCETGMIKTASGAQKYYAANDNLVNPLYTALSPESIITRALKEDLHYCPKRETGVMFQFLSAVREVGKVGVVCVANTRYEADDFVQRARLLLDQLASEAASGAFEPSKCSYATSL